jgi:hypothetical protein
MLPDWIDPERATQKLERILADKGMIEAANDAMQKRGQVTHLPGFCILDRGQIVSPYQWCVPRPRTDEADVVNAWEEYVDRNLGLVPNPGFVARSAVGKGNGPRYFGAKRTPCRWRVPLVKLAAVAQHCNPHEVSVARDRVRVAVGDYRLEVTSRGAWSNFHNRMIMAKKPAIDLGYDEVSVPPIKTTHALASFLSGRVEDDVLWLANAAIQGERFNLIPRLSFEQPKPTPLPKRRRALAVDVLGAGLTCQELLAGPPDEGLMQALYAAAVPTLMTARYFRNHFGTPYGPRSQRIVTKRVREEWAQRINAIVEDLQNKK